MLNTVQSPPISSLLVRLQHLRLFPQLTLLELRFRHLTLHLFLHPLQTHPSSDIHGKLSAALCEDGRSLREGVAVRIGEGVRGLRVGSGPGPHYALYGNGAGYGCR